MTAYHQMGFQSDGLNKEPNLWRYRGAILSPVNFTQAEISKQVAEASFSFDMIFDPQLYFPNTERGILKKWSYFPSDVETADLSSDSWWMALTEQLAHTCHIINPKGACSPAVVPRAYTDEYFTQLLTIGNRFAQSLEGSNIRPIQSVVVSIDELSIGDRCMEVASILTRSVSPEIYLVLVSHVEPRREIRDTETLKGAMRLIAALEDSGIKTIVGFCSSDLVLWKAAGASSCATGKFFNLRRFTSSRFEEPSQGGGQLPYWFEDSLMAFLRESDVLRLLSKNGLSGTRLSNPYSVRILHELGEGTGAPWLGLGWRQWLFSFAELEGRLDRNPDEPAKMLERAERSWILLEDETFLMEEPRNDGSWLRPWRRAVAEFRTG